MSEKTDNFHSIPFPPKRISFLESFLKFQMMEFGDANCDGTVNSGDVVYLIGYLFRKGPLPGCF